jgi:predicted acetyltransferase
VTSKDWPLLAALHTELTRPGTGTCLRDSRRWALVRMNVPGREMYAYEDEGGVAGYILWERGETLEVLEMLGQMPSARRGLAGFLARQPGPVVRWSSSPALLAAFGFSAANAHAEPDIMLRPVNLEALLKALHAAHFCPVLAEKSASLTLCAFDALCPENARPLRLTPMGIEMGSPRDPHWLRADIQSLGPLLMGYSLPSDAHRQGLLTTDSTETLALADLLFPLRSPYVAPLDQS